MTKKSTPSPRSISLFIIPTPIGNLKDITFRALETLQLVDVVLAEDTRTSGFLLQHYQIKKPILSFHIFNEHKKLQGIIERMKQGEIMALVSDAGTPGISDPGYLLIRACIQNQLSVECLPGATALIPALVQSGFPCDHFVFEGFLPHKKGRQTLLQLLAEEKRTIVLYESPHRLKKLLEEVVRFFGKSRPISIVRELTKIHEETIIDTAENVLHYFSQKEIKGEIVLVISGTGK